MIHLAAQDMHLVKKILRFHLEKDERVFAFGSRATGVRLKKHSDLDLCVKGRERLPILVIGGLKDFFSVSNLPMRVDVVDWHDVSPSFRAIIDAACEEIIFRESADV